MDRGPEVFQGFILNEVLDSSVKQLMGKFHGTS